MIYIKRDYYMTKEEFEATFEEDRYIFEEVLNPNGRQAKKGLYSDQLYGWEQDCQMLISKDEIIFRETGKKDFIIPNNKYISWITFRYQGYSFSQFKSLYFDGQVSLKNYFEKYSLEEIDKRVEQMNLYKNNLIEIESIPKEKLYPESYKLIKKIQEKIPKKSDVKPVSTKELKSEVLSPVEKVLLKDMEETIGIYTNPLDMPKISLHIGHSHTEEKEKNFGQFIEYMERSRSL
jgi:hypothetical protein